MSIWLFSVEQVADFGLVKLVERSDEEECMATRLVGTPGYLPPELVFIWIWFSVQPAGTVSYVVLTVWI